MDKDIIKIPAKKIYKGFSIIEILVVIAIIIICLATLLGLSAFSLKISSLMKETGQANSLAQEAIEAVRNFRDGTSWNIDGLGTLIAGSDYYPRISGSPAKWQIVLGAETSGIFTRKIVFDNVLRDVNNNIILNGGANDPDTKKITVTVDWGTEEVKITSYLTNWK